jgi:hypothetical protein
MTIWYADTVISPDDEHMVAQNMLGQEINILNNCAPSWLYLQE